VFYVLEKSKLIFKNFVVVLNALCLILEQNTEWQQAIYLAFMDFEKEVDSGNRTVMWKLCKNLVSPENY
jgi:hypothetical protein